ncbi:MAG: hypothetical protein ACRC8A_13965 [Microcoleaceae cyanobacterium]
MKTHRSWNSRQNPASKTFEHTLTELSHNPIVQPTKALASSADKKLDTIPLVVAQY